MIQFIVKGNYESMPEEFIKKAGHYIAEYENLSNEQRKELKKLYPQGFFRLGLWERGGSDFEEGEAQIVCGLDGEKLVPVVIKNRGWRANENHALFIGNSLCVVEAKHTKKEINLVLKKLSVKPKIGILQEEVLWEVDTFGYNEIENIPEHLQKFKEALETTVQKVLEYRCTDAMYYLD